MGAKGLISFVFLFLVSQVEMAFCCELMHVAKASVGSIDYISHSDSDDESHDQKESKSSEDPSHSLVCHVHIPFVSDTSVLVFPNSAEKILAFPVHLISFGRHALNFSKN